MLNVSTPVLSQENAPGYDFVAEKLITVECGSVTFPDGDTLNPDLVTRAGYLLQRDAGAGAVEMWDKQTQMWVGQPAEQDVQPMFLKNGKWQGLLVALGQNDASGDKKFGTDQSTGYPKYSVCCLFKGKRNALDVQAQEGMSPASSPVQISLPGSGNRAGLTMVPEDPTIATEIRLYVKDAVFSERGFVSIRQSSGSVLLEIVAAGARISIMPDGRLVLTPGSGQGVQVEGNLFVTGIVTATNI